MQVVIEIYDELYDIIKREKHEGKHLNIYERAIMDGTILPTHGRLIDADEIVMKEYEHVEIGFEDYTDLYNIIAHTFNEIIEKAPTVLEASEE